MTLDPVNLQNRARLRWQHLERQRQDPRSLRVLAKLVGAGLLRTNHEVPPHRGTVKLEAMLWAGEIEPRILELVPALVLKKPGFFSDLAKVPEDLKIVITAIKRGEQPPDFRGVPAADFLKWLPVVGHRNKLPTLSKTHRFQQEDLRVLAQLKNRLGLSESEIVRLGLRALLKTVC